MVYIDVYIVVDKVVFDLIIVRWGSTLSSCSIAFAHLTFIELSQVDCVVILVVVLNKLCSRLILKLIIWTERLLPVWAFERWECVTALTSSMVLLLLYYFKSTYPSFWYPVAVSMDVVRTICKVEVGRRSNPFINHVEIPSLAFCRCSQTVTDVSLAWDPSIVLLKCTIRKFMIKVLTASLQRRPYNSILLRRLP